MSKRIVIDHTDKYYGKVKAIDDVSLEINPGEFFTLLGPSGCGKTTLLRMIAGFNTIERGEIRFDDQVINNVPSYRRNIGMVFQSYAIFPHMTVEQNVAYGLKARKIPKDEMKKRVEWAMDMTKITPYRDRQPQKLSGGQQQRVALARAMVINPDLLLMDEPLSNLDAKLRVEMRTVIKGIQRDVGITTVYVTHDQEEAMAISDRIAVMSDGVIRHCGKPKDIYQRPADLFVATFIGKSNLIHAELVCEGASCRVRFGNGYSEEMPYVAEAARRNRKIVLSARPEELLVHTDLSGAGIGAVIKDSVFLGLNTHYFVEMETGEEAEIIQESRIDSILNPGTKVRLTLNAVKANAFDSESGRSLMRGVHNELEVDA